MKKCIKTLIILLLFAFIRVNAEDLTSELGNQQIYNCTNKSVTLTGCFYNDKTKSQYETIAKGTSITGYQLGIFGSQGETTYEPVKFDIDSIKFDRAYTSINSKGESVVGLCYKGYVNTREETSWLKTKRINGTIYSTKKDSANDLGIIYLRIISLKKGKCEKTYRDQVVFQDMEKASKIFVNGSSQGAAGGIITDATQLKGIDTTGYEGNKSLQCPKYLSFSENMSGFAKFFNPEYEYIFSDAEEVKRKNNWFENLVGVDTEGRITGCIEESVEYHEDLTQCFENKVKTINGYSCPEKLTDIKIDTSKHIDDCVQEYSKKHNVALESARLLANQTAEYGPKLKEAGTKKVQECYENLLTSNCNLTQSEKDDVIKKLKGSECEKGCSQGTKPATMDPNGKCYICNANSSGGNLKWEVTPPTGCTEYTSAGIDDCYGSTKNQSCRNCYKNVISSLSDDKKTCVLNLLSESSQAISNVENEVDQAFESHEQETNQSNADQMRQMYNMSVFTLPGLSDGGFGPTGQDCKTILGSNGVKVVVGIVNIARIAGVIIAIANGMLTLIPAVISKDADGLKKAEKKLIVMAVALAIIGILPTIVYLIGGIFDFDLSCLFSI